jgi:4-hydroxybenzoate polyprenyltransferase
MGENTKIGYQQPAALGLLPYVRQLVILLRPKHWVKNLFIFVPLFFAGKLFDLDNLIHLTGGFIAFSLVASGVYILNDYKDIQNDRLHPEKKNRPLASGAVGTGMAFILMLTCIVGGFLSAWFIRDKFFVILALYFILNVAYSFGLKNVSILDILIVAAGFVFRIKAGGAIAFVGISQWLMIMVFLLALFIALAKRRDDILIGESSGKEMRKAMSGYNMEFLNVSLAIVTTIIIVAYLMYTISPEVIRRLGTYRLYYTSVFVLAGLMRYLQLVYIKQDTGSPVKILYKDHFIQACIALWILSFYSLIYLPDFHFFEQSLKP